MRLEYIFREYGGPDGELGASMRYLSQRFSMPYPELAGVLTDIGTEELGHLEMVGTIVHQLTRNLSADEIKQISKLGSKNVLLATVLGTMNAPIAALARAINAIAEKQGAPAGGAAAE